MQIILISIAIQAAICIAGKLVAKAAVISATAVSTR